jgi:lipoate synthase
MSTTKQIEIVSKINDKFYNDFIDIELTCGDNSYQQKCINHVKKTHNEKYNHEDEIILIELAVIIDGRLYKELIKLIEGTNRFHNNFKTKDPMFQTFN